LDDVAWHYGNDDNKTHPVGTKQANEFGLYDMSGNVKEWTQDCHHNDYEGAPLNASSWRDNTCRFLVLRGGGKRAEYRTFTTPRDRRNDIGFRLAHD